MLAITPNPVLMGFRSWVFPAIVLLLIVAVPAVCQSTAPPVGPQPHGPISFPENVLLLTVRVPPKFASAPPAKAVLLPVKVLPVIVNVPWLVTTPPSKEAKLSEMVLSEIVSVPWLKIAPPVAAATSCWRRCCWRWSRCFRSAQGARRR